VINAVASRRIKLRGTLLPSRRCHREANCFFYRNLRALRERLNLLFSGGDNRACSASAALSLGYY